MNNVCLIFTTDALIVVIYLYGVALMLASQGMVIQRIYYRKRTMELFPLLSIKTCFNLCPDAVISFSVGIEC